MPGDPLKKEERMGVIKGWEWSTGAGRALQDRQACLGCTSGLLALGKKARNGSPAHASTLVTYTSPIGALQQTARLH